MDADNIILEVDRAGKVLRAPPEMEMDFMGLQAHIVVHDGVVLFQICRVYNIRFGSTKLTLYLDEKSLTFDINDVLVPFKLDRDGLKLYRTI
jgi:hypothetical protein